MEDILYYNTSTNTYFIITTKGSEWNVCIDIISLSYKFISNELLNSFNKINFSKNAIINLCKELNIYDENDIKLDNFDEFNYINYKCSVIKVYNWIDLLNFIIALY